MRKLNFLPQNDFIWTNRQTSFRSVHLIQYTRKHAMPFMLYHKVMKGHPHTKNNEDKNNVSVNIVIPRNEILTEYE